MVCLSTAADSGDRDDAGGRWRRESAGLYGRGSGGGMACRRSVQHGIYAQGCQRRCGGTAALCGIRCALFPCAAKHISRCGICAGICREPLGARHAGNRWRVVGGGVLGSAGAGTAPWRSGGNRRLQLWRFFCQLLDAGGGSGAARCRTSLSERLSRCRRRKDGCGDDRCL